MDIKLEKKPWYIRYRYYLAGGVAFLAFLIYVVTLSLGPSKLRIEQDNIQIAEVKNGKFIRYFGHFGYFTWREAECAVESDNHRRGDDVGVHCFRQHAFADADSAGESRIGFQPAHALAALEEIRFKGHRVSHLRQPPFSGLHLATLVLRSANY